MKMANPIPLDEAKARLDYNPETGALIWRERDTPGFKRSLIGKRAGSVSQDRHGYWRREVGLQIDGRNRLFRANRLAWALAHGPIPDGMEVDHINGDSLGDRLENLRLVTPAENKRNARVRKDNKTGYPGVKVTRGGKFAATAGRCGRVWLGSYETFDEAVSAKRSWEARKGFHPNHGRTV